MHGGGVAGGAGVEAGKSGAATIKDGCKFSDWLPATCMNSTVAAALILEIGGDRVLRKKIKGMLGGGRRLENRFRTCLNIYMAPSSASCGVSPYRLSSPLCVCV